ncbi:hypothetical protein PFISCL1PPCAC_26090, partial [Pristionchus fissidentatus]
PICVRGAFYGKMYDEMIARHPTKFMTIVPYTSRVAFRTEVVGRTYHFVSEDRMRKDERNGELIELLYLNDDLYGLTIGGVKEVIRQGQHCILDVVYDRAIRILKLANINPIVIFVKPSSPDQIM